MKSFTQDITKQKQVDKALNEGQELYKQLVEHANDIIFRIDIEGYFTYINPVAVRIMGFTEKEVLGEHFTKGIVPAYRRKMVAFYERQQRNQIQNTYYEYPVLTNEGAEKWLGQNVQLIWEKGQIRGFQAVARDITERIEAEQSLREVYDQLEKLVQERTKELKEANVKLELKHSALVKSEHRLRQLVESTNAIPWESNARTWQYTYVGPQAVRLLGYPVKKWYEQDFWVDHIHPEDKDYAIKYCRDSSLHFNDYEFDYRMITANGNVVWLHDIVKVDKKNGEIDLLRGFMIDITKQKKVEEEMHKVEEEASMHRERLAHIVRVQTLGEMASGIAHEISQPLAAINSYAQASQRHLQTGQANSDKIAELINKISGQARRAGFIVNRLRSMMQRRVVNPMPLDINTLLYDVSKIAEIDTRHNNCLLMLKFTSSLPKVIGDEIQIQQVALNLIRNAVDAMDSLNDDVEKEIIVETKRKNDNEVEISVTDCGPGISSLDADNIFDAFYSTKDSGLGIGLSICRSIIEDHGGEIGFYQNKAGGATFHFSLPVDSKED